VLQHHTKKIDLPWRKVTEKELADAQKAVDQYKDDPKEQWKYLWNQGVVDRYEAEKAGTSGVFQMELHALRLGDVAIATNEFELFTDYGVQMKARSPAVQTFLIQLTGSGGYLPDTSRRGRRQLQRHHPKQPRRPRRRPGARG
jgi:hypothetical protein